MKQRNKKIFYENWSGNSFLYVSWWPDKQVKKMSVV